MRSLIHRDRLGYAASGQGKFRTGCAGVAAAGRHRAVVEADAGKIRSVGLNGDICVQLCSPELGAGSTTAAG